jgi:hypothetical protein
MTTDPTRGMTTIPMLPSDPTAPAKTPAQLVAAPIPARTIPAVVRPAVFLIADEELRLLDQTKTAGCVAQNSAHDTGRRLRRAHGRADRRRGNED